MEYKVEVQKLDRVDLGELKKCLEGKEMKWEYFDLGDLLLFYFFFLICKFINLFVIFLIFFLSI